MYVPNYLHRKGRKKLFNLNFDRNYETEISQDGELFIENFMVLNLNKFSDLKISKFLQISIHFSYSYFLFKKQSKNA